MSWLHEASRTLGQAPKLLLGFEGGSDRVTESFVFQTFGEESALNIIFQPWNNGDFYLISHPGHIPTVHPGETTKTFARLYLREGDNRVVSKSLVEYVGKQTGRQIEVWLTFEDFHGYRFRRGFVLRRPPLDETLRCYPGPLEAIS